MPPNGGKGWGADAGKQRTLSSQLLARAQARWKEERQKRLRQPRVAPFRPHSLHFILRPLRTASGTSCPRHVAAHA